MINQPGARAFEDDRTRLVERLKRRLFDVHPPLTIQSHSSLYLMVSAGGIEVLNKWVAPHARVIAQNQIRSRIYQTCRYV